jgi:hypothetical protein
MDTELQLYGKDNVSLNLLITDLRSKLKAADVEIARERESWKRIAQVIKQFKIELNECAEAIQNPKMLKVCFTVLLAVLN